MQTDKCRNLIFQRSSGRIEGKVSNQFESKSMVLLKKLEESYEKLPQAARVDLDVSIYCILISIDYLLTYTFDK